MITLTLEGSDLTRWRIENELMMKDAQPLPYQSLRLFVYNYERWLFHALNMEKPNPRSGRITNGKDHIFYPMSDCTLYIRKSADFSSNMRRLVKAYLPFRAGLMDGMEVSLWDEGDTFLNMDVTSVEENGDDFMVYYTHPDGTAMQVSGSELGDDEIMNLLTAFVERDGIKKLEIPLAKPMTIETGQEDVPPMPTMDDFMFDSPVELMEDVQFDF